MGKKSRRKREKTLNFLRQNAAETVDVVEEEDPSYKTIENRPREIAQLTLKHRFGGAHIASGNLRCVKIRSGVVEGMRKARRNQRDELFDGDTQIWAAWDAMALDEEDGDALDEYIGAVVGTQFARMIMFKTIGGNAIGMSADSQYIRLSLKTVKSWPRVRPHWKRFRRRLCDYCPACAHLAEPRFLVCSGCGIMRYCSEECQREHWPVHQKECLKWQKLILQQKAVDIQYAREKEKGRRLSAQLEALKRQADAPR